MFPAAIGLGISIGVPLMQSNVSMTGAIGAKQKVIDALPAYTRDRVGDNENFINKTTALAVGPAQAVVVFIVGRQEGAPAVDLWIALR